MLVYESIDKTFETLRAIQLSSCVIPAEDFLTNLQDLELSQE